MALGTINTEMPRQEHKRGMKRHWCPKCGRKQVRYVMHIGIIKTYRFQCAACKKRYMTLAEVRDELN